MSEAYLNRIFPAMRSAYPSEWVATIEKAQAMDVNVYVPGHGFVESPAILKEELETFRKAILQVIAEARRLRAAGLDADAAAAQAKFGDLETWTLQREPGRDRDPPRLPRARRQATSAGPSFPHPRIAGQLRAGRTCRTVREAGGAGPRRRA